MVESIPEVENITDPFVASVPTVSEASNRIWKLISFIPSVKFKSDLLSLIPLY